MPSALGRELTQALPIPVIGSAAGAAAAKCWCCNDMLGITQGKLPRFVRNFMSDATSEDHAAGGGIGAAVRRYVVAVKDGSFPVESIHTY